MIQPELIITRLRVVNIYITLYSSGLHHTFLPVSTNQCNNPAAPLDAFPACVVLPQLFLVPVIATFNGAQVPACILQHLCVMHRTLQSFFDNNLLTCVYALFDYGKYCSAAQQLALHV